MLHTTHWPAAPRRNRLSLSTVPKHVVDTEPRAPSARLLFEDGLDQERSSDIIFDKRPDGGTYDSEHARVEAIVMNEVADWLQLREGKEYYWPSHTRKPHQMMPFVKEVFETLKKREQDPNESEFLVHFIALQMLASCYTVFPASSANGYPLFQQNNRIKLVTALRLHSHHRLHPAAGHHARECSETSPWPGLYSGPSLEEQLAEDISRQRHLKRHSAHNPKSRSSHPQPHHTLEWSDGPAPPRIPSPPITLWMKLCQSCCLKPRPCRTHLPTCSTSTITSRAVAVPPPPRHSRRPSSPLLHDPSHHLVTFNTTPIPQIRRISASTSAGDSVRRHASLIPMTRGDTELEGDSREESDVRARKLLYPKDAWRGQERRGSLLEGEMDGVPPRVDGEHDAEGATEGNECVSENHEDEASIGVEGGEDDEGSEDSVAVFGRRKGAAVIEEAPLGPECARARWRGECG